jgi:hypothetical protein
MFNSTGDIATPRQRRGAFDVQKYARVDLDLSDYRVVAEIPLALDKMPDRYLQAVQALRDVRHMLPSAGVAIVDAVLNTAY